MATITVRNLSPRLVTRIKTRAQDQGHSMEQEIRQVLEERYPERSQLLESIQSRWDTLPSTS